ncbi:O-antigen ligase [uncultured Ruminococcus sp.]|uniref:O-antigen ligase family protein n=1 Tax=uncultured Ruminococcus sp. TaxID=165186 RepID=UPI0025FED8A3|nr:O-antigen ligase family protein [uncultured Ruminococcus sp.]
MIAVKEKLKDSSLFRKLYIADLFFCNIAFLQIPAYVLLVFLFVWGVGLVIYNQRVNNTFFKLRFGLWVGAFLVFSLLSIIINFSATILYSLIMFIHVLVCFFVFYGMHTEPNFDFRSELYSMARFIVYVTTVANIIGIFCLMFGIRFEWYWIKFTIYENRFTGVYVNPNLLGFVSVVSIVCCHMLYKEKLMKSVNQPRVSKIWIFTCIATNLFSLILCDSNASLVLALAYAIVYLIYIFFADKTGLSASKIIFKIIALVVVGAFLASSALMLRTICQTGFSVVLSKTNSIISVIMGDEDITSGISSVETGNPQEKKDVTFGHENKNIDSGRFKLWKESINLFKISPFIGISNGNIVFYSEVYSNGVLNYSYHKSDLHNGYLTILVSTGIIGFLLFGIFGFRFAKHSAQHLFLQKKTFRNDVYPCLFAFLFAYLIYAMFEKALLYDISFMVMWFWLMMGYMSCYIAKFEPMLETQYLFHRKRLTRTLL